MLPDPTPPLLYTLINEHYKNRQDLKFTWNGYSGRPAFWIGVNGCHLGETDGTKIFDHKGWSLDARDPNFFVDLEKVVTEVTAANKKWGLR